ncbi:MAG: uncharacterized protein JWN80_186, partial [Microbacteriaceae bacterium]|nr:uncharacterized protein [Microbacteriaceae bacterium]
PSGQRTPWNIAARSGDDRVLPAFRRLAHLRERLVPYLAESARDTIATGAPLMRPLYFDHPGDDGAWSHPLQWMLGPDLLVAPVTSEGATEWTTYLPPGEWVDAWTGERISGGREHSRQVPLDEVPVYVRHERWAAHRETFARQ